MDNIERLKAYLLEIYPVRRSVRQKNDFRKWLLSELKKAGWNAHEEAYGKWNGSVNVVAGNPEKASVFLCAHYDTGTKMPVPDFVSPTNVPAHVCYHLAVSLVLIALVFGLSLAVCFPLNQPRLMLPLFLVLALAMLWVFAYGPANQANANGNSSGVLALLCTAWAVQHHREICFVFLDNHEKNMLGASAFQKKHPNSNQALVLNFDCVGNGQNLLLIPSKHSRWDAGLLQTLEKAFQDSESVHPKLLVKGLQYYPSDQKRFRFHVAVCACHYLAGLGFYIPRLKTKRDTILDEKNIAYLTKSTAQFLPLYLEQDKK